MGIFDRLKKTQTDEKKQDAPTLGNENASSKFRDEMAREAHQADSDFYASASRKLDKMLSEESEKNSQSMPKKTETEAETETEKPKGVFATNPNLKTVFNRNLRPKREQVSDDGKDPR